MGITHFLAGSRAVGVGVARAHVPARHAARPNGRGATCAARARAGRSYE